MTVFVEALGMSHREPIPEAQALLQDQHLRSGSFGATIRFETICRCPDPQSSCLVQSLLAWTLSKRRDGQITRLSLEQQGKSIPCHFVLGAELADHHKQISSRCRESLRTKCKTPGLPCCKPYLTKSLRWVRDKHHKQKAARQRHAVSFAVRPRGSSVAFTPLGHCESLALFRCYKSFLPQVYAQVRSGGYVDQWLLSPRSVQKL